MPWYDTTEPLAVGEGLTFTKKPGTKLFTMQLEFTNARPMRCTIKALNWRQAEQFAKNRHPNLSSITRL